jgi:hypothetical protein
MTVLVSAVPVTHLVPLFSSEGGVGLVPKCGCLLTLAYYAFPRWYDFGERRWNDIDRGKPKNSEKNLSQCHFVHQNPTWIDPGANPGLPGERPATNHLSHGTALLSTCFASSNVYWLWTICWLYWPVQWLCHQQTVSCPFVIVFWSIIRCCTRLCVRTIDI